MNEPTRTPAYVAEHLVESALAAADAVRGPLRAIYQGPTEVVDQLLIAVVAGGHVLLEGVPGVAKTTVVTAFSQVLGASFKRIQFTPDLMPSDVTGTSVLNMQTNAFELRRGPIFAHIVLADEVNRAPAKTQSAMLEAMAEAQVTVDGTTLRLPEPFLVLATQNPVEQEGVYPLPEAQLDRFLLKIEMGYPSAAQEVEMLARHGQRHAAPPAVLSPEQVLTLRGLAERVHVSEAIRAYLVGLARWTRKRPGVRAGASPRATLALMRAARARALLSGRDFVVVDDVRALAVPVFAHRLVLTPIALVDGTAPSAVVQEAVKAVPYDPA